MAGSIQRYALLDTCYWYALLDRDDGHRPAAERMWPHIERLRIVAPWPVLYETLNTRVVKHASQRERVRALLRSDGVERICDRPYRDEALRRCLDDARPIALVDHVLRAVIEDMRVRLHVFVTFNARDFYDVCKRRRGFELWDQKAFT